MTTQDKLQLRQIKNSFLYNWDSNCGYLVNLDMHKRNYEMFPRRVFQPFLYYGCSLVIPSWILDQDRLQVQIIDSSCSKAKSVVVSTFKISGIHFYFPFLLILWKAASYVVVSTFSEGREKILCKLAYWTALNRVWDAICYTQQNALKKRSYVTSVGQRMKRSF